MNEQRVHREIKVLSDVAKAINNQTLSIDPSQKAEQDGVDNTMNVEDLKSKVKALINSKLPSDQTSAQYIAHIGLMVKH